jgi:hypothetical protein
MPFSLEFTSHGTHKEFKRDYINVSWFLFPLYENDHILIGKDTGGDDGNGGEGRLAYMELYDRRVPKVEAVRNNVAAFATIYGGDGRDLDGDDNAPPDNTRKPVNYIGKSSDVDNDGDIKPISIVDNVIANTAARWGFDRINEAVLSHEEQKTYYTVFSQTIRLGYTQNQAYRESGQQARYNGMIVGQFPGGFRDLPFNSLLGCIVSLPEETADNVYAWNNVWPDNWEQLQRLYRPETDIMGGHTNMFGSDYAEDLYRRYAKIVYKEDGVRGGSSGGARSKDEQSAGNGEFHIETDSYQVIMHTSEMWNRSYERQPGIITPGTSGR